MEKINETRRKINNFFKYLLELIRKPVMSILPGQLSFFLLLSIIPIILIMGIIASAIGANVLDVKNAIIDALPAHVGTLITPLLKGRGLDYNIIVLIVSALLLVSKGTRSIIRVASVIYETKDINSLGTFLKSIAFSIILIVLMAFLIVIPVLGSKILEILGIYGIVTENIIKLYSILKWPLSVIVIFINLKIIYIYSPNRTIPSKSVNKGALFTSILWVVITAGYSFYITYLTKYDIFYGGAANIIILMLWLYLMSYVFVLGMSINASYLKSQN
ncbi:MAG: YihY/virulence factor BrkB family protein [Bacilli bacterium]|nr:YihY/virulence factor BrkB family protein [Bacilli bacterium]MBO6195764.1 YihY/virulence factor BrkB family protein [Bacilli bacterium]